MKFCTDAEYYEFMREVPGFEQFGSEAAHMSLSSGFSVVRRNSDVVSVNDKFRPLKR